MTGRTVRVRCPECSERPECKGCRYRATKTFLATLDDPAAQAEIEGWDRAGLVATIDRLTKRIAEQRKELGRLNGLPPRDGRTVRVVCGLCEGTGRHRDEACGCCENASGTYLRTLADPDIESRIADGEKWRAGARESNKVNCPDCDGEGGHWNDDFGVITCKRCDGSGHAGGWAAMLPPHPATRAR